jgi:hypothetical protein
MGCSSCTGKALKISNGSLSTQSGSNVRVAKYTSKDCDYTKEMLEKWYKLLYCVLINNKANFIGITNQKINSFLGYIQSALNYPENYCYYMDTLSDFEQNILPRIIENVPNCNNY